MQVWALSERFARKRRYILIQLMRLRRTLAWFPSYNSRAPTTEARLSHLFPHN